MRVRNSPTHTLNMLRTPQNRLRNNPFGSQTRCAMGVRIVRND
jgi:hypothetical protein